MVVYCEGVPTVVIFEISASHAKTFHCPRRLDNHQVPPVLCDVCALALLSLNFEDRRFVAVTMYRCRVRFRRPGIYI